MAQSSEDVPEMLGGSSAMALPVPLHKAAALRLAELAVLLLRASAVVLLLSPAFVAAALLLG